MPKQPKQYRPSSQQFHEAKEGGPDISPGEAQRMPPAFGMNTTDPTELGHEEQPPNGRPLNHTAPNHRPDDPHPRNESQ